MITDPRLHNNCCITTASLVAMCCSGTHTFSRTMPLAWEAPPKGLAFRAVPRWAFLYCLSCHFCSRRWLRSFLAVRRPRHFPGRQRSSKIGKRNSGSRGLFSQPRFGSARLADHQFTEIDSGPYHDRCELIPEIKKTIQANDGGGKYVPISNNPRISLLSTPQVLHVVKIFRQFHSSKKTIQTIQSNFWTCDQKRESPGVIQMYRLGVIWSPACQIKMFSKAFCDLFRCFNRIPWHYKHFWCGKTLLCCVNMLG